MSFLQLVLQSLYSLQFNCGRLLVLARNAILLWKHYFCHHEQKVHHCTLYESLHSVGTFCFSRLRENTYKRNICNSYLDGRGIWVLSVRGEYV